MTTIPGPDARAGQTSLLIDAQTGRRASVAEWVAAFADLWTAGARHVDRFMDIFDPGIVLIAPGFPPSRGYAEGLAAFRRTFRAFPDLTGEVVRWSAYGDVLFVEMTFRATVGGRRLKWHNVDRFLIRDGAVVERVAYFNPSSVRRAMLSGPAGFAQMLRLRLGQ